MKYNPVIEIKSFKPALNLSEETLAFTGRLYIDGKPVAQLSNRGHGDDVAYHTENNERSTAMLNTLSNELDDLDKTERDEYGMSLQPSLDWFLAELAGEMADRQAHKREVSRKSWVRFADKEYEENGWTVFDLKWSPEARAKIEAKWGAIKESRNDQVNDLPPITFRYMAEKMGVKFNHAAA